MRNEEVVEDPLPMRSEEQPMDWELMEDIIEVFEIYKLLKKKIMHTII